MKGFTYGLLMLALTWASSPAQRTNTSSVLDSSGTRSTGGSFTNISAAGQPGGIAESAGGGLIHQAGFLHTFFLRPDLDTDGDGIANEADPDNDNDGLTDSTEIGGDAFDPATATMVNQLDTDEDGMSDGQEAIAGSDPTDVGAHLYITSIVNTNGTREVAWFARSNKTYRVLASDYGYTLPTNELITVTASGFATAPWYSLTNTVFDGTTTNARFYAVEVLP